MKKIIYIVLSLITVGLIGYTLYYTYSHKAAPAPVAVATSTPEVATTTEVLPNKKTLTTRSGKSITVTETNPIGQSLSTISIETFGFATNTSLVLEKNKLTDSFLTDINHDSYDELVLITTAQGSGSYGEAIIYTTTHDLGLLPVTVPDIKEKDTKKGGLFEGYIGHDTFMVENGTLVREFPTSTATDTQSIQSGPKKKMSYTLVEKDGLYTAVFTKYAPVATSTATTTVAALPGTSWVWVRATASGTPFDAPKGDKFVLTFGKDTSVRSTTDCNSLSGNYVTSKDTIRFSAFISTLMFCEGSQEATYSSLLAKTKFFKIQGTELTLALSDNETMTFKLKQ